MAVIKCVPLVPGLRIYAIVPFYLRVAYLFHDFVPFFRAFDVDRCDDVISDMTLAH